VRSRRIGLDRVDPDKDIRIILIEAADRILPALPERISEATLRLLLNLGVEVRTGAKVSEVRADGVCLASGEFIPSELVVWAAGVKGPEFLRNLDGLEVNRINQLVVTPTLQTSADPSIFAIGDCAACPREGHTTPVPPRAQAAHHRPRISSSSCAASSRDRSSSLSSTATSVHSYRSANTAQSVA
jgi:NADH:ubiquinone reductase (H+-translocating)